MNLLIVGQNADLSPFIDTTSRFLLIADELPDLTIPRTADAKVVTVDWATDGLNPLKGMNYHKAREFISILDATFPEGQNTLTKKNSNYVLLKQLLLKPKSLDRVVRPDPNDPAKTDAYQKIDTLLSSPFLSRVLSKHTIPQNAVVLARINRAELGNFDAFVLANFLISQFKGQVIIEDGAFYLREHHIDLIYQNRLMVGVSYLGALSDKLRQAVLMIKDRRGAGCLYDDAVTLAHHAGEFYNPAHPGGWPAVLEKYTG